MADVLAFARRELFDPLGMRRATLEFDATGTPLGSGFMLASARDWARLGLLYLDDGVVAGRRILPRGWVGYSSGRHQMPGSAMGRASGPISMRATAPRTGWARACRATSFFGRGKFGQYIIVVPSARLVVVRLGVTHGWEDIDGVSRLTANVIGALDRHSAGMSSRDAAPPTHLRQ